MAHIVGGQVGQRAGAGRSPAGTCLGRTTQDASDPIGHLGHRTRCGSRPVRAKKNGLAVDLDRPNVGVKPQFREPARSSGPVPAALGANEQRRIRGQLFARRPCSHTRDDDAAVVGHDERVETSFVPAVGQLVVQSHKGVAAALASALDRRWHEFFSVPGAAPWGQIAGVPPRYLLFLAAL
jgi:hypothetical protein